MSRDKNCSPVRAVWSVWGKWLPPPSLLTSSKTSSRIIRFYIDEDDISIEIAHTCLSRRVWRILATWRTWQVSQSWRKRSPSQELRCLKSLSLSTKYKLKLSLRQEWTTASGPTTLPSAPSPSEWTPTMTSLKFDSPSKGARLHLLDHAGRGWWWLGVLEGHQLFTDFEKLYIILLYM